MADDPPSLARNLRAAREHAGMSQQQVAASAGLSVSIVSQIEQGKTADPRISTIMALARALGVGVDDLTRDSPAGGAKGKRRKG